MLGQRDTRKVTAVSCEQVGVGLEARLCGRGSWTEQLQWRGRQGPPKWAVCGILQEQAGVRREQIWGLGVGEAPQGKQAEGGDVEPCEHSTMASRGHRGAQKGGEDQLAHHQGPQGS